MECLVSFVRSQGWKEARGQLGRPPCGVLQILLWLALLADVGWPAVACSVSFEELHFSVRTFLRSVEGKSVFLQVCNALVLSCLTLWGHIE